MLQYRLSTLFLIFFAVAATMALFGAWGIWMAGVLFIGALCVNRAKRLRNGGVLASLLIMVWIICPGLMPSFPHAGEESRCAECRTNLKCLGLALLNFHNSQKHFPAVDAYDKNGKPLFSWMVQVLPYPEYDFIYGQLTKDEPWDSPTNSAVLNQASVIDFLCPSAMNYHAITSNYIAIIGPGTIWRNDGTVKLSDLPDGGSHTVALVEVVDSGKHWAEPFALTVDEVLANMKTGKGVQISSFHPTGVHVLFADGAVRRFPSNMPIPQWRNILDGKMSVQEMKSLASDTYVGNPAPKLWPMILGVFVWLISIVLLFHRAVKSRKKPETTS